MSQRPNPTSRKPRPSTTILAAVVCSAGWAACTSSDAPSNVVSSRSYRGHESDIDITNFVNVYPATVGTRLDDCQTCHKNATMTDAETSEVTRFNPCDYCHFIPFPAEGYVEALPASYRETLNPYGLGYADSGRSQDALRTIEGIDSDGDGFGNADEIADLKYPGDPASRPGQPVAPLRVFTMAELRAMPVHSEFMLANSNRQQFDTYASYRGVKVAGVLEAAGVDLGDPALLGITVAAPDGYLQDIPLSAVTGAFPPASFHGGLDVTSLGAECGFVQYPSPLPAGIADGQPIPDELWTLLAYERDGIELAPVTLDAEQGKIDGEGPLRLVVPQFDPGPPDRGSRYSPTSCNDGYDYDETADHNAGSMVRGAVAIRVNPLPEGTEDFDYYNGGWAFVDSGSLVVYGHGVVVP